MDRHDAICRAQAHPLEDYSPKWIMALAGPPRRYENVLAPRLFSHQCLEGEFYELRFEEVLGNWAMFPAV